MRNYLEKIFSTITKDIENIKDRIRRLERIPTITYTAGKLLFGSTSGAPTEDVDFSYDSTTNTLTVPNITVEDWIAPTLLNGWANYGGGESPAGYHKDPMGYVHLRGLIKDGTVTAGTVLFTLPPGYRPAYELQYPTVSNNAFAVCSIQTDGDVRIMIGTFTWYSLDLPPFKAA